MRNVKIFFNSNSKSILRIYMYMYIHVYVYTYIRYTRNTIAIYRLRVGNVFYRYTPHRISLNFVKQDIYI